MSDIKSLQDIFDDDDQGLLNVKPVHSNVQNADLRLIASFNEINDFYRLHQREPLAQHSMTERMLSTRLQGIRADSVKAAMLVAHDEFGLLASLPTPITSLTDIFADDDMGLLLDGISAHSEAVDLFNLKHVSLTELQRAEADFVSRRRPCKDFSSYEVGFKAIQKDLLDGQRRLLPYSDKLLEEGRYYVNNGIVLLLERIEALTDSETLETGKRIRKDGRTRCIFENGTESNMLYRSVSKILYANGQVVGNHIDDVGSELEASVAVVTTDDLPTGYIYVLKSNSTDPRLTVISNLFKIGYSTTDVAARIKNACEDPTYLMSQVSTVAVYDCFNLNPQKFEQLLHQFFGKSCLEIVVTDKQGQEHTPREWFIVPFNMIQNAIELIISGEIVSYRYDEKAEEIILR
jgi:T5orf172 domain